MFVKVAVVVVLFSSALGAGFTIPLYDLPKELYLCGERVPLERPDVWEQLDQAFMSSVYNTSQVILWIKRANRYFPYVEKRLKERGLPDDLKYVLVVESAFKTYAVSSAKAVGPWQFILPTAKKYGLRVDTWIDERYNFEKATEAALNYLSDLYQMYGNWGLAIAAYNCGENKMSEKVKLQQTASFYDTDLPLETEAYIFRVLAAKIILAHPEAYGYKVPLQKRYPVNDFDEVEANLPRKTPVMLLARAAGTTYKVIKEMNPEILKDELPPGTFKLRIPKSKGVQFQERLSRELASYNNRK